MRRFRLSRFAVALATTVAAFGLAKTASAYDALGAPCLKNGDYCVTAPIHFDHTDKLPIEWSFDTGWVPQGSPLEVRVYAGVYAHTHVALFGRLETSWPDALTIKTPGDKEGSVFDYHYGAEFHADGQVTISIAGQTYSWMGSLPFIPKFDLQVQASQGFEAWGFNPGVTIQNSSMPQKLASISVGDIIGGSIPGIDGGFELDVAVDLKATYTTTKIVTDNVDGSGSKGPILKEGGQTSIDYTSGPNVEVDVHPEGTVDYDGTVHIIPAFYVSLLGKKWSIPVADIPIGIPTTSSDWVFDAERVHVPLPDLLLPTTTLDFGEVEVGEKKLLPFSLINAGEGRLAATVSSDDPQFEVFDASLHVDANGQFDSAVRFAPTHGGVMHAKLLVASNDPNAPVQVVELTATGHGLPPAPPDVDVNAAAQDAQETGACACRTAGGESSSPAGAIGMLGVALALALRTKKRAAR
jgi:MYXO-CTERM domain-containing protein